MRKKIGSNQYKTQHAGIPLSIVTSTDLLSQVDTGQARCGDVWGTKCKALVGPPDWSHGSHPSTDNKLLVAKNPNTPIEILTGLAQDQDKWVRQEVAKNPNTPTETLTKLAQDQNMWVRREVVWNPNTPVETLTGLAQDQNMQVRYNTRNNMAANPNTPPEVLVQLLTDQNPGIRKAALDNPSLPPAYRALANITQ